MILGTTFCTYESAFTPEECDKIIELGLKSNKQKGTTWGNQEKTDDKKVSQANKTIHELQNEHGKSINDINPYIRDSEISWLKEQWMLLNMGQVFFLQLEDFLVLRLVMRLIQ